MIVRHLSPARRVLSLTATTLCLAVGCTSKPQIILPPVPMDSPADTPSAQKSAPPGLPPGLCPKADSLGPVPGDTVSAESLESPLRLISMPDAVYPESERQQGWEGDLTVRILVGPDGLVARVEVGDGRDPFLLAAARAACGAQFAPVRSDAGEPLYAWTTRKFAFRLKIGIPQKAPRRDRTSQEP